MAVVEVCVLWLCRAVPLKSIDVEVAVKGFIASVTATLIYRNTEEKPIEAIYEFPMDDQSAVFHFEAQTEGRTIIAECQEKQQVSLSPLAALIHCCTLRYTAALIHALLHSYIHCCTLTYTAALLHALLHS